MGILLFCFVCLFGWFAAVEAGLFGVFCPFLAILSSNFLPVS